MSDPTIWKNDIIDLGGSFINRGTTVHRDYDLTVYFKKPNARSPLSDNANGSLWQTPVARFRNLNYQVNLTVDKYYEVGSSNPAQVRSGNRSVSGSFERGFINASILRMILGTIDGKDDETTFLSESELTHVGQMTGVQVDIVVLIEATGQRSVSQTDPDTALAVDQRRVTTIIFEDAIFTRVNGSANQDSWMVERIMFEAKGITTKEENISLAATET